MTLVVAPFLGAAPAHASCADNVGHDPNVPPPPAYYGNFYTVNPDGSVTVRPNNVVHDYSLFATQAVPNLAGWGVSNTVNFANCVAG